MNQREWLQRASLIRLTSPERSQAVTKQLLERYHALATEDPFHHTCAHVCFAARGWLDGRISGRIFGHK